MYLTKAQIESRLKGSIAVTKRDREFKLGRAKTREERVLVGVLAKFDTNQNVADAFGTSKQSVSQLSRGLVEPLKFDKSLRDEIDKATPKTEEVSNKALDVLMSAIGVVDKTVNGVSKATDASMVARNMATVYGQLKNNSAGSEGSRIMININAPNQKKESDYETLEVVTIK